MAKFLMTPTIHSEKIVTARIGGNASGTRANDNDVGKPVKLGGDSNYVLCAANDPIQGIVTSVETGLYDGFYLGGVVSKGYANAIADGSQAAGTGALTVGQYVLAAAPEAIQVAKAAAYLKVRSATDQAAAAAAPFKARVVSLGDTGTGAVGTTVVIELL
jgi:hypothetical protein